MRNNQHYKKTRHMLIKNTTTKVTKGET